MLNPFHNATWNFFNSFTFWLQNSKLIQKLPKKDFSNHFKQFKSCHWYNFNEKYAIDRKNLTGIFSCHLGTCRLRVRHRKWTIGYDVKYTLKTIKHRPSFLLEKVEIFSNKKNILFFTTQSKYQVAYFQTMYKLWLEFYGKSGL